MNDLETQFDRLPPHSIEAEQSLIASLLLCDGNQQVFSETLAIVTRDAFYLADHQTVFDAVCELRSAGKKIDAITVRESLRAKNLYEEIGGDAFLGKLLHLLPSWAHYKDYAKIVRNKAMFRAGLTLANDFIRKIYQPHATADESAEGLLNEFSVKAAKVAAGGKSTEVHRLGDVARVVAARRFLPASERSIYIPTGIASLDRLIGGVPRGGKTIIGGKPGMGKSALLKQFLLNIAASGITVGLITIEEGADKVAGNALSTESGIRNNRIRHGTAAPEEWDTIEFAAGRLEELSYFVVDTARKISKIVAMAGVLASQYGCQVIGVDHLHIIDGGGENRNQEITQISAALKWCWKDLNVAGIEAAQLNRAGGSDRPTLANLRESGSLEQDGDVILLLHREDYYRKIDPQFAGDLDEVLEIIVAKNKDGATGSCSAQFDESIQSIRDRTGPDGMF